MHTTQGQATSTNTDKKPLKEKLVTFWQKIINNDVWADINDSVDPVKIILIGLVLLGIYSFKYELNEIYKEFVVCTLLERFTGDVTYDVIAGVIWIAVIIYCIRKARHLHKFHLVTTLTVVLICCIYFFFRLHYTEVYYFYGFSIYPNLAYFDILLLPFITFSYLFLFNGVLLLRSYFKKDDFSKGFLTDSPLGTSGNIAKDLFGWQPKAKQLVNRIDESNVPHSFAIGISSEWGSGKTSFFSLVNNELDQRNKSQFIKVHFNPWLSNDTNKIIDDFFSLLQDAAKKFDSKLSSDLVSYSSKLQSLSPNALTNLIHTGVETFYSDSDLSAKYNNINNLIKRLNRKIIIFIDDLDRLNKKEVVEVLRIIRNTSNFYNTFFILAYDRAYINTAAKDINDYNPDRYLDKIVQFEMSLPNFNPVLLNDIFLSKLHSALEPATYEPDNYDKEYFKDVPINTTLYSRNKTNRGIWDFEYDLEIYWYLENVRDIVRFINQFLFEYKPLREQVNFKDFILLSLIKFKYPIVWQLLANNDLKHLLFDDSNGKLMLQKKAVVDKLIKSLINFIPKNTYSTALDAYLNYLKEEESKDKSGDFSYSSLSKGQKLEKLRSTEKIWTLLSRIFDVDEERGPRSIIYSSNYYLYFFKDASISTEYSLSEFYSDVNDSKIGVDEFVGNIIQKVSRAQATKALTLFEQISSNFSNTHTFEKIVMSYSRFIYKYTEWSEKVIFQLVDKINKANGDQITQNTKKAVFKTLVDSYQSDINETRFISWINYLLIYNHLSLHHYNQEREETKVEFVNDIAELQKLNYQALYKYKYKKLKNPFTKEGLFDLFYYNLESIDKEHNNNVISRKALSTIRYTILRHINDYLEFLIRPKFRDNPEQMFVFEPYTFTIFKKYKGKEGVLGFEQFLNDLCVNFYKSVSFQRVVTMYAAIYTLNQDSTGKQNIFIKHEEASLHIEDYAEWHKTPLHTPINNSARRHKNEMRVVLQRICPIFLNEQNYYTNEVDMEEFTETIELLRSFKSNIREE